MGTAITMFIAFLLLTTWLPPHWKRRAVGYGLAADITVHFVLQSMFGGDANGRAGLLLAGVLINFSMHAYRRFYGYELLSTRGWVRHPGLRTSRYELAECVKPPKAKRKAPAKAKPKAKAPAKRTPQAPRPSARKTQAIKRSIH